MRDKYPAEDMAPSYAELEQSSKAVMALYFQEYYCKQQASLGDTQSGGIGLSSPCRNGALSTEMRLWRGGTTGQRRSCLLIRQKIQKIWGGIERRTRRR